MTLADQCRKRGRPLWAHAKRRTTSPPPIVLAGTLFPARSGNPCALCCSLQRVFPIDGLDRFASPNVAAKQSKESCGRKSVTFIHRQCRRVASVACHLCDV